MTTENPTNYVAGFMFDRAWMRVALIRKEKPAWQAGKLNGIGGKVEQECIHEAMVREFAEETGYKTSTSQWGHFLQMTHEGGWRVDFFATLGNLSALRSMEREKVEIVWLKDVSVMRSDMIENLPWLIPLAVDFLTDGVPGFVEAHYGDSRCPAVQASAPTGTAETAAATASRPRAPLS